MTVVDLDVLGTPAPKGSSRAIMRGSYAVNVPGSSDVGKAKLQSWDTAVRAAAIDRLGFPDRPVFVDVPVAVIIVFRMKRPAGHWGKGRNAGRLLPSAPPFPVSAPDVDKLARATLDPLTGIVFDDDGRCPRLWTDKVWATPGREGASILVCDRRHPRLGELMLSLLSPAQLEAAA